MSPQTQTEQPMIRSTAPSSDDRSQQTQTNDNRLEVVASTPGLTPRELFRPVMSIDDALVLRKNIVDFVAKIMVRDQDYGVIPGTSDKPVLLKPGAEKLCSFFGLEPEFTVISEESDLMGEFHGGEPYYSIRYHCRLTRHGITRGVGEGSCNSWESKYRWRDGKRKCPMCVAEAVNRSKDRDEWYCWAKRGGCGAVFKAGSLHYKQILEQKIGRVPNPDIADAINTIQKMAQKRALVPATLLATSGSEFFTQDMEDHALEPETPASAEPGKHKPVASAPAPYNPERPLAGQPETPQKPWSTHGEMKAAFASLRERVGETRYQEELTLSGVQSPAQFKSTTKALDCYRRLSIIAEKEVA